MAKSRKTIEQRISLDGGKEILDTLKALGKDGEKAFQQLQKAAKDAGSPGISLAKSIATLRKNVKELGAAGRQVGADFANLRGSLGEFGGSVATVGRRLTGFIAGTAAAGVAIGALAKQGLDAGAEIQRLAQVANTTPESFQRLAAGARTVGIEQDKLADILKDTTDRVGDFLSTGGGPMADFFEKVAPKVGLTAQNFKDLSGPDALQLYVSSLQKANLNQAEMTFYLEAIASDATLLIPLLKDGGAEMERLGQAFADAGGVINSKGLTAIVNAQKALGTLRGSFSGIGLAATAAFAPSIERGATGLSTLISENRKAINGLIDGALNKAIPLIEDFIALFTGGPVRNLWVIEARDQVVAFADSVRQAVTGIIVPAYELLIAAGEKVAASINSVFGTEFSAQQVLIAGAILKLLGVFASFSAALGVVVGAVKLVVSTFALIGPVISSVSALFGAISLGVQAIAPALAFLVGWPALLVAAFVAAGVAIYVFWDEIVAAGKVAFEFLTDAARGFGRAIAGAFAGVVSLAKAAFDGIATAVRPALDALIGLVNAIASRVVAAFTGIKTALDPLWLAITGAGAAAWDLIGEAAFTAGDYILRILDAVKRGAQIVWNGIVGIVSAAWDAVRLLLLAPLFDGLTSAAEAVWDGFRTAAESAIDFVVGKINAIKDALKKAADALRSLRNAESSGGSSSTTAIRRAGGGFIRGAGTATSDSIPAWLSNGEFVIKARAVREYGIDFFAALNSMRLPKFATGGPVSGSGYRMPSMPRLDFSGLQHALTAGLMLPAPRFATGGPVLAPAVGGRPLSLTIGGETFGGLTAPDDVADRLSKFARGKQLASAGRKPKWYSQ